MIFVIIKPKFELFAVAGRLTVNICPTKLHGVLAPERSVHIKPV
jgi:hypothetical protein